MKSIFLLLSLVLVVKAQETYGTGHDDVDAEAIVANEEQFKSFIACFMDTGPCTELMAAFKEYLGEAIVQACAKCTAAQKHIMRVFNDAYKKRPEEYEKFKQKYDPQRKYFNKLEAAVAAF